MKYLGIIIFFAIFFIVFLIARAVALSNTKVANAHKEFIERESRANSVRKADISNLNYISVDIDSLPVEQARAFGLEEEVAVLTSLSDKKILNLSQYTNTDLKLMYGPANLDILTDCDTNYISLIRCLDKIGKTLYEADRIEEAIVFFEYAIEINSDITNTYITLGDIYAKTKQREKLNHLISKAKAITSLSGPGIVSKLKALKA